MALVLHRRDACAARLCLPGQLPVLPICGCRLRCLRCCTSPPPPSKPASVPRLFPLPHPPACPQGQEEDGGYAAAPALAPDQERRMLTSVIDNILDDDSEGEQDRVAGHGTLRSSRAALARQGRRGTCADGG